MQLATTLSTIAGVEELWVDCDWYRGEIPGSLALPLADSVNSLLYPNRTLAPLFGAHEPRLQSTALARLWIHTSPMSLLQPTRMSSTWLRSCGSAPSRRTTTLAKRRRRSLRPATRRPSCATRRGFSRNTRSG
eukprot:COSAG04_NODE_169_length_21636_cov_32.919023_19_plen_133_part_00